jgi:hypothetical protein
VTLSGSCGEAGAAVDMGTKFFASDTAVCDKSLMYCDIHCSRQQRDAQKCVIDFQPLGDSGTPRATTGRPPADHMWHCCAPCVILHTTTHVCKCSRKGKRRRRVGKLHDATELAFAPQELDMSHVSTCRHLHHAWTSNRVSNFLNAGAC